jgi:hypothetical protein
MTMTQQLKRLREEFECDGTSIADIEIPAALLISDVCQTLGLEDWERREVLGPDAARYVDCVKDVRVRLSQPSSARKGALGAPSEPNI